MTRKDITRKHAARIVSALQEQIEDNTPLGDIVQEVKWGRAAVDHDGQVWFYMNAGSRSGWYSGATSSEGGHLICKDGSQLTGE